LDLRLGGPIVIMSACQSGLGKAFEEGTFGLARGWRNAGSGQIIMSLWDVDDEATKLVMTDFMKRLVAHARPEDALRQTMLKARDEWKLVPALWSGFAMFGVASR
jgi:CHAT domain-containing protein